MTSTHITSFKLYKSNRIVDKIRTRVSRQKAHRDLGSAVHTAGSLWSDIEFAG